MTPAILAACLGRLGRETFYGSERTIWRQLLFNVIVELYPQFGCAWRK
jgi:hypothetical protein